MGRLYDPTKSEVLQASTTAIAILRRLGYKSCLVGGVACMLYGNNRVPSVRPLAMPYMYIFSLAEHIAERRPCRSDHHGVSRNPEGADCRRGSQLLHRSGEDARHDALRALVPLLAPPQLRSQHHSLERYGYTLRSLAPHRARRGPARDASRRRALAQASGVAGPLRFGAGICKPKTTRRRCGHSADAPRGAHMPYASRKRGLAPRHDSHRGARASGLVSRVARRYGPRMAEVRYVMILGALSIEGVSLFPFESDIFVYAAVSCIVCDI